MQITLAELFVRIDAAQQRMSRKNPHRVLLQQCREVIEQVVNDNRMVLSHLTALTPPSLAAEPSRVETHAEGSPQAI